MLNRLAFMAVIATSTFPPSQCVATGSALERLAPGQPPAIVAHRAKGSEAPDNSIAAIEHAIARGIDFVEIDIQMTRDGQYVLMHDATLKGNTNILEVYPQGAPQGASETWTDGYYAIDFTLEEIGRLRLSSEIGGDHPIPVLNDVLDLMEGRVFAILELKTYEIDSLALVLSGHEDDVLLFSQVNVFNLEQFANLLSETGIGGVATPTGASDILGRLDELVSGIGPGLKMVNVYGNSLTPEFVERAAEFGVMVCVNGTREEDVSFVSGTPSGWRAALESGASAFLTGQPDSLMELIGR